MNILCPFHTYPDIWLCYLSTAEGEIFQHDRAPCRRSHTAKECLAIEGVTVPKDWPDESPDIKSSRNMDRTKESSSEELMRT